MLGGLIAFFVTVAIVALLWWVWTQLRPLLPLPAPLDTIVNVFVVVVLSLAVIYAIAGVFDSSYGFRTFLR